MTRSRVRVEKMAAGGDAIAHLADGRVVFVPGALPDELVDIDVVVSKRDFARAAVHQIVEPSPFRVAPPCPERGRGCGGCGWQQLAPDAQLAVKVTVVEDALRRTGKISEPVIRAGASVPAWHYRTTVRLAVGGDGRVGLRAESSNRVVALGECGVAHPSIAALFADLRVSGAEEVSLRTGVSSGERSAWADGHRVRIDGLPADVSVGPRAFVHETVAGRSLRVSATSFFQSGPDAAELLVQSVRDACGDALQAGEFVDAYGGIGLFASTLGTARAHVVESSSSACADAVANLADRDALVECVPIESWEPTRSALVVADPARSGLGREASSRLAATDADRLVLVSCDPVSLAHDSRLLDELGYRLVDSEVLDLFPNTPHVEVVSRFDRRGGAFDDR